jgi:hypothetical protein
MAGALDEHVPGLMFLSIRPWLPRRVEFGRQRVFVFELSETLR